MGGGLLASYGTLGVMAGRFLYSGGGTGVGWQFVDTIDPWPVGESREYTSPAGAMIVIARQGTGTDVSDFIALSRVCPHLGCQVHWEPQHSRFFCPCHNGAFDAQGMATEGPPAKAKQQLLRFPLWIEAGRLFIEVPLVGLDPMAHMEPNRNKAESVDGERWA